MGVKLGFQAATLLDSFTPSALRAAVGDFKKRSFLPELRRERVLK